MDRVVAKYNNKYMKRTIRRLSSAKESKRERRTPVMQAAADPLYQRP